MTKIEELEQIVEKFKVNDFSDTVRFSELLDTKSFVCVDDSDKHFVAKILLEKHPEYINKNEFIVTISIKTKEQLTLEQQQEIMLDFKYRLQGYKTETPDCLKESFITMKNNP